MIWKRVIIEQGYVQIKNFLLEQQAKKLREQILKANYFKAWNLLTTPYGPLKNIKDQISNSVIDHQRHQQAVCADNRDQFAFSFYRSNNKHAATHQKDAIHQYFCQQLKDNICPDLGLTGEIRDSFFALFKKEQFIGYHGDKGAGQYAFIYQLSKGWKKKYGGQLVLYPKQIKFYKKNIEPEFNSLTLLKIDHPMYHSVNRLNNPTNKPRITISGWLE